MEAGQLVRIEDLGGETLAWTRPNFFALRYELSGSQGVFEILRVQGIGPDRQVLAETASGAWRIELFPMDRPVVPVFRVGEPDPVAEYDRRDGMQLRLTVGAHYQLRRETPLKMILEDGEHLPIFTLEQVDAFPRWRVEVKLEATAPALPELPILLAAACCSLVFSSYRTGKAPEPEMVGTPTLTATG